jgi:hypothetical protein
MYGPGSRASLEDLYGPASGSKPFIRGKGQYSARDEILIATDQLIHRQARDLKAATGPKPRCNYAHADQLDCRNSECQRWLDRVVAWHEKNVGGPHARLTASAAIWLDRGYGLEPVSSRTGAWRRQFNPVVLGEGPTIDGPWTTFALHVHEDASSSDVHALVDRLWKEAHTRAGRLARPARAVYWRRLSAGGLSHEKIADSWLELTCRWAGDPGAAPGETAVERDAYREWQGAIGERGRRKRARTALDGDGESVGGAAVGWTFAKLAEFETGPGA